MVFPELLVKKLGKYQQQKRKSVPEIVLKIAKNRLSRYLRFSVILVGSV